VEFSKRCVQCTVLASWIAVVPLFGDTFHSADVSSQLGSSPDVQAPFDSVLAGDGPVSGNFIYDARTTLGILNVFFSSFPGIVDIPKCHRV
jgi:hypothetical protein